mmetsp:Transcript_33392/g.92217  ORF Transcript_33392/g.92217 Transcript_33392/m.92217 type:complete len:782 (-) Transcript_33392:224-2569(-)
MSDGTWLEEHEAHAGYASNAAVEAMDASNAAVDVGAPMENGVLASVATGGCVGVENEGRADGSSDAGPVQCADAAEARGEPSSYVSPAAASDSAFPEDAPAADLGCECCGQGDSVEVAHTSSSARLVYEVNVMTIDGTATRLEVSRDWRGAALKQLITEKLRVPMDRQRLICRGRAIHDDDIVGQHVLESGQTIHLVQRPEPPPQGASDSRSFDAVFHSGQDQAGTLQADIAQVLGAMLTPLGAGSGTHAVMQVLPFGRVPTPAGTQSTNAASLFLQGAASAPQGAPAAQPTTGLTTAASHRGSACTEFWAGIGRFLRPWQSSPFNWNFQRALLVIAFIMAVLMWCMLQLESFSAQETFPWYFSTSTLYYFVVVLMVPMMHISGYNRLMSLARLAETHDEANTLQSVIDQAIAATTMPQTQTTGERHAQAEVVQGLGSTRVGGNHGNVSSRSDGSAARLSPLLGTDAGRTQPRLFPGIHARPNDELPQDATSAREDVAEFVRCSGLWGLFAIAIGIAGASFAAVELSATMADGSMPMEAKALMVFCSIACAFIPTAVVTARSRSSLRTGRPGTLQDTILLGSLEQALSATISPLPQIIVQQHGVRSRTGVPAGASAVARAAAANGPAEQATAPMVGANAAQIRSAVQQPSQSVDAGLGTDGRHPSTQGALPWNEVDQLNRRLADMNRGLSTYIQPSSSSGSSPHHELNAFLMALHGSMNRLGVGISDLHTALAFDRMGERERQDRLHHFASSLDSTAETLRTAAAAFRQGNELQQREQYFT